jgi:mitochondrial division protein 1
MDDSFDSTINTTNNNLSKLSKAVSSTAATLVLSQYGDLANTHFQTAMSDIASRPAFQKRMFSFASKKNPTAVVKSSLSKDEIRYQAVTMIPDELLRDIPLESSNQFSLFQGFRAMEEDYREREIFGGTKQITESSSNLNGKITRKSLIKEKETLDHRLDLLEIRKDLAANEINEIDERIAYLQSMREIVFDRVAGLEQEELHLEQELRSISLRLDDWEEEDDSAIGNPNEDSNNASEDTNTLRAVQANILVDSRTGSRAHSRTHSRAHSRVHSHAHGHAHSHTHSQDQTENTHSNQSTPSGSHHESPSPDSDHEYSLLSKSIYGKLQESVRKQERPKVTPTSTPHKKSATSTPSRRRRTMPTLQQYYTPGKEIRTITAAHNEGISALDFDIPFGTMACTGVEDSSITLWDLSRGEKLSTLPGHNAFIKCLQMNDNFIVSGSMDATAKLWNIENEHQPLMETFESHLDEITALHFSETTLVTGSADRTIRQWDMNTGRCLQTLDVLWAAAQNPAVVAEDRLRGQGMAKNTTGGGASKVDFVGALQCFDAALASGTADGVVRLWDLRSGQVHRSLIGHTGPISCLQFDDMHLTTGSLDRSIRIWDLRMGSLFDAFAYEKPVTSLQFDSRRIVSSNCDNTVKVYDRILEKHWSCGAGEEDETAAIVKTVRYKEGYLIEGREDGRIGIWAV